MKNTMNQKAWKWVIGCLASVICAALVGQDNQGWTPWPKVAFDQEMKGYIEVPPGFKAIEPLAEPEENTGLNGRFRSSDGRAEFAIVDKNTRFYPGGVDARRIKFPITSEEKVISRETEEREVVVENYPPYLNYGEHVTVKGPGYTRYLKLELTTGSIPGCFSILWEFKVTDDKALKDYRDTYRKFKESYVTGFD